MVLKLTIPLLIILIGCQNLEWLEHVPKEFHGTFYQVSNDIIQGHNKPIIIEIRDEKITFNYLEEDITQILPIVKVNKSGNKVVLFCREKNKKNIADYRYTMIWGVDNFLYIDEIVATGHNDDDEEFTIGKFTNNNYLLK